MQGMEICVEDGTTSPTHSKSVSSCSSSGLSTTSKLETSLPVSLFYAFILPILHVYNLTVNQKISKAIPMLIKL
jgi:hypothetical protein